jgi:ABC-type phosphate/phosphonate transport system substrate-binding protein
MTCHSWHAIFGSASRLEMLSRGRKPPVVALTTDFGAEVIESSGHDNRTCAVQRGSLDEAVLD